MKATVIRNTDVFNTSDVAFDAEGHTYYCRSTGKRHDSATGVKKRIAAPFDPDGSIIFSSAKKAGLLMPDGTPDVCAMRRQWNAKRDWGTVVHAEIEGVLSPELWPDLSNRLFTDYSAGRLSVLPGTNTRQLAEDAVQAIPLLMRPQAVAYPEATVSYRQEADGVYLAGRADLIVTQGQKAIIYDFKTDGTISRAPWRESDVMAAPFQFVRACKLDEYKLQLSLYGFMVRQAGYEVDNLVIIHISPDGVIEKIPLGVDWIDRIEEILRDQPEALATYPNPKAELQVTSDGAGALGAMDGRMTQTEISRVGHMLMTNAEACGDQAEAWLKLDFLEKAVDNAKSRLKEEAIARIQCGAFEPPPGVSISVKVRNTHAYEDAELERLDAAVKARKQLMDASRAFRDKPGRKPGEEFVDESTGEVIPPSKIKSTSIYIDPRYPKS